MKLRIPLALMLLTTSVVASAAVLQLPAVQLTIGGVAETPDRLVVIYEPATSSEFNMFGDGSVRIGHLCFQCSTSSFVRSSVPGSPS